MVWCIVVALMDNVLKPLLLGRGLPVPILVVFLGAMGGFLAMGIIGLFVGPIMLSVGYKLFLAWLDEAVEHAAGSARGLCHASRMAITPLTERFVLDGKFCGFGGSQVVRLREVLYDVVKLPLEVVEARAHPILDPRQS